VVCFPAWVELEACAFPVVLFIYLSFQGQYLSVRFLRAVVQFGGRYCALSGGYVCRYVLLVSRRSQIQLQRLPRILGGGGELVLGRAATHWIFFLFFCSLGTFHFSKVKIQRTGAVRRYCLWFTCAPCCVACLCCFHY
jgi:hypothetical protein